jgi:hypothetical protein
MSDWGVWCRRGDDPDYGWFRYSEGTPIHYRTESEAHSIASGLKLLLPHNEYEARPMPEFNTEGAENAVKFREALESISSAPAPRSLKHVQALALIAAQRYIESLEKAPGTDLYLTTGKNPTYPHAALCVSNREEWIKAAAEVTLACMREEKPPVEVHDVEDPA